MGDGRDTAQSRVKTSSFKTRDGIDIEYGHLPADSDAKLVLVHSLAMDHTFWLPVMAAVEGEFDVVAIDCRGHGKSDKPAGPYAIETMGNDVADLADHLGWKSVFVAGASMGGVVAQQFAIRNPGRTAGIGLFDTTAWYGPTAEKDWAGRAEKARTNGLASMTDFQVTRWFSDAFRENNPDIVRRCVEVFKGNDVDAYAATCAMMGDFDLRSGLGGIAAPCAIAVGEEDYATPPAMAKYLHENIAGSTFEIVKGGRHLMPLEKPELVAEKLLGLKRGAA